MAQGGAKQRAGASESVLFRRRGCANPPMLSVGPEFKPDAKIAAVIRSGSVIGRAPIVSMPHWGGILSSAQVAELVAYLKTLK